MILRLAGAARRHSIVEGEHELWSGLSEPYKDTIRAFLVHFQHQVCCYGSERSALRMHWPFVAIAVLLPWAAFWSPRLCMLPSL